MEGMRSANRHSVAADAATALICAGAAWMTCQGYYRYKWAASMAGQLLLGEVGLVAFCNEAKQPKLYSRVWAVVTAVELTVATLMSGHALALIGHAFKEGAVMSGASALWRIGFIGMVPAAFSLTGAKRIWQARTEQEPESEAWVWLWHYSLNQDSCETEIKQQWNELNTALSAEISQFEEQGADSEQVKGVRRRLERFESQLHRFCEMLQDLSGRWQIAEYRSFLEREGDEESPQQQCDREISALYAQLEQFEEVETAASELFTEVLQSLKADPTMLGLDEEDEVQQFCAGLGLKYRPYNYRYMVVELADYLHKAGLANVAEYCAVRDAECGQNDLQHLMPWLKQRRQVYQVTGDFVRGRYGTQADQDQLLESVMLTIRRQLPLKSELGDGRLRRGCANACDRNAELAQFLSWWAIHSDGISPLPEQALTAIQHWGPRLAFIVAYLGIAAIGISWAPQFGGAGIAVGVVLGNAACLPHPVSAANQLAEYGLVRQGFEFMFWGALLRFVHQASVLRKLMAVVGGCSAGFFLRHLITSCFESGRWWNSIEASEKLVFEVEQREPPEVESSSSDESDDDTDPLTSSSNESDSKSDDLGGFGGGGDLDGLD